MEPTKLKHKNVVKFSANQLMLLMSDETLASLTVVRNAKKFVERKIGSDLESFRKLSLTQQQRRSKKLAEAVIPWEFLKSGKNAAARKKLHQKTRFIAADYVAENFAYMENTFGYKDDVLVLDAVHRPHLHLMYENISIQEKAARAVRSDDDSFVGDVCSSYYYHRGALYAISKSKNNKSYRSESEIWHMFAMHLFLRMYDTDILEKYKDLPYTINYSQTYEEFTRDSYEFINEFIAYDNVTGNNRILGVPGNLKYHRIMHDLKSQQRVIGNIARTKVSFAAFLALSTYNENFAESLRNSTRSEMNYILVRSFNCFNVYADYKKYKIHFDNMIEDLGLQNSNYNQLEVLDFNKYIKEKAREAQLTINHACASFLSIDNIIQEENYLQIAESMINLQKWIENYFISNESIEIEFVLDFYKLVSIIEKYLPDSALRKDSKYYGTVKSDFISPAQFFGFFNAIGMSNIFNGSGTYAQKMHRDMIMGLCTIIEDVSEDEYDDYEESLISAIRDIGTLSHEHHESLGYIKFEDFISMYNDKNMNIDIDIVKNLLNSGEHHVLNEGSALPTIKDFYKIEWR